MVFTNSNYYVLGVTGLHRVQTNKKTGTPFAKCQLVLTFVILMLDMLNLHLLSFLMVWKTMVPLDSMLIYLVLLPILTSTLKFSKREKFMNSYQDSLDHWN